MTAETRVVYDEHGGVDPEDAIYVCTQVADYPVLGVVSNGTERKVSMGFDLDIENARHLFATLGSALKEWDTAANREQPTTE